MATEIGKKARNAPSVDTHIHFGRSQLPPNAATCGASAISGIVCEAITYGSRPRSITLNRAITIASAMPNTPPRISPTSAIRNVYQL